MDILSEAEVARLPNTIAVTLTKDEAIAVLMQLVRVDATSPKRSDCKSAFVKIINAAQAPPPPA